MNRSSRGRGALVRHLWCRTVCASSILIQDVSERERIEAELEDRVARLVSLDDGARDLAADTEQRRSGHEDWFRRAIDTADLEPCRAVP
jgi:hypothetical protein